MITAGNAEISIFEIDAVDLLSPNGGSCGVGDTVAVRWAVNTPPRCDSLSLFLRRDSLWLLDTIARRLPGNDTLYRWVVPADVPDTGRVVVIAYGKSGGDMTQSSSIGIVSQAGASERVPGRQGQSSEARDTIRNSRSVSVMSLRSDLGHNPDSPAESGYVPRLAWQFDISDRAITFIGGGVADEAHEVLPQWSLFATPNPTGGVFSVRYTVPHSAQVRVSLLDVCGRTVRVLDQRAASPGSYSVQVARSDGIAEGVYYLRLQTSGRIGQVRTAKLVVQK